MASLAGLEPSTRAGTNQQKDRLASGQRAALPQIVQKQWCRAYAICAEGFSAATVGAKSLNLKALQVVNFSLTGEKFSLPKLLQVKRARLSVGCETLGLSWSIAKRPSHPKRAKWCIAIVLTGCLPHSSIDCVAYKISVAFILIMLQKMPC